MSISKTDLVRVVKRLGVRDQHFQYPAVREALDVRSDEKDGSSRLHNLLKQMIKHGAVEIIPGSRERNRYYRIKSEEKLREFAPSLAPPESAGVQRAGGPDRLARIEAGIQGLNDRLEQIEARLIDLAAAWS